jgi:hypothetical protein
METIQHCLRKDVCSYGLHQINVVYRTSAIEQYSFFKITFQLKFPHRDINHISVIAHIEMNQLSIISEDVQMIT